MNGNEVACKKPAAIAAPGSDRRPVGERRDTTNHQQRGEEPRNLQQRRRLIEERVQIEPESAGDKEDRDQEAVPERVELRMEQRVRPFTVTVEKPDE